MDSGYGFSSHSDEDYTDSCRTRKPKRKRRKTTYQRRTKKEPVEAPVEEPTVHPFSINALLDALPEQRAPEWDDSSDMRDSFEEILTPLLSDLLETERLFPYGNQVTNEGTSPPLRLLSMQEASKVHNDLKDDNGPSSQVRFLLAAKARLHSKILRRVILNHIPSYLQPGPLTPLHIKRTLTMVNPQVLDALYAIETTRYENSFLSRIQGFQPCRQSGVIDVDWETQTPWINLMTDIREHYSLSHPERDQAEEVLAPIIYCTLQRCHLDQVHDLLARAFWVGINVSDSLDHNPEKCTIVATYKQLVVGAAFLSSPQEGYITYLAVRSGWDNSQIATSMLYHLITLNRYKDITLHVSINNPAMLLYNRFGFKAEEFIVGFYEDYLDPNSPQSKNAFRLRLRR